MRGMQACPRSTLKAARVILHTGYPQIPDVRPEGRRPFPSRKVYAASVWGLCHRDLERSCFGMIAL